MADPADLPRPSTFLQPPTEFGQGQYERLAELGHGASGRVFECKRSESEEALAVKVMHLRGMRLSVNADREQTRLRRELDILRKLPPHPKIVQMVDALEEGDWFFLVLELVRGGDLFGVLMERPGPRPRLLEKEAACVFWQLVEGLSFLHGQNVIHRDLKLENILIASQTRNGSLILYSVKITDFGLSKAVAFGGSRAHSTVGTRRYVAPEVIRGGTYDFRVDIWSLGILLYILLQGSYPHDRPTHITQEKLDEILSRIAPASSAARTIVTGMLQLDPEARVTLAGIQQQTWTGDEPQALEQGSEAEAVPREPQPSGSTVHTDSLFGSGVVDVILPPGPPGPTTVISSSLSEDVNTAGDVGRREPEQEPPARREEGLAPSTKSILRIGIEDGMLQPTPSLLADQDAPCVFAEASTVPAAGTEQASAARAHAAGTAAPADEPCKLATRVASGVALSNVRAASAGLHEMHLHLVVPNRFAGMVLGRDGSHLRKVIANTGCNAWMTPRDGDHDRSVVILGSYGQCSLAQTMFHHHLSEAMQLQKVKEDLKEVTVVLFLRDEVVARVIGKKGEGLRQVYSQSNASVNILRDEVEGKRPCIIRGKFQHVLQAEKLIDDRANSVPAPRPSRNQMEPLSTATSASGKRPLSPGSAAAPPPAKNPRITLPPSAVPEQRNSSPSSTELTPTAGTATSGKHTASSTATASSSSTRRSAEAQPCTKLLIPSMKAGAVIGKHGASVLHIRDSCHVKVEVLSSSETPEWPGDRVVIINGSVAARQAGADAVLRAAFPSSPAQVDAACALKILVRAPKESLSAALENVVKMCGVRAQLGSDSPLESGEQCVSLEGQLPQVSAALSFIGILEQASSPDGGETAPSADAQPLSSHSSPRSAPLKDRGEIESLLARTALSKDAESSRGRWVARTASGLKSKPKTGGWAARKASGLKSQRKMGGWAARKASGLKSQPKTGGWAERTASRRNSPPRIGRWGAQAPGKTAKGTGRGKAGPQHSGTALRSVDAQSAKGRWEKRRSFKGRGKTTTTTANSSTASGKGRGSEKGRASRAAKGQGKGGGRGPK